MWRALAIASLVAACGGKPVGSKVPRPNPTDVAVVAAAAATALTLANPDAAGRKPESEDQKERQPQNVSDEPMPADVLDRADQAPEPDDAELPPCKPAPTTAAEDKAAELFPEATAGQTPATKRCRDVPPPPDDDNAADE